MNASRSSRLRVLFPLLVSAAACGGAAESNPTPNQPGDPPEENQTTPTPTPAPGSTFDLAVTCIDNGAPHWAAATPSAPIDGIEIRRKQGDAFTVVATPKTLCTRATDGASCNQTTAAVTGDGWDPWGGQDLGPRMYTPEIAVTTTADQVTVLRTVNELAAALAPLDTPDEALIIAHLRGGWRPVCDGQPTVLAARADGDAWELFVRRGGQCGAALIEATIRVARNGATTVVSEKELKPAGPNPCGRRPEGLLPMNDDAHGGVAGLLARMAWLEAASVPAFAALARDLARHGAPPELVERALSARSDEIMHARLTREAARRYGASPERPRITRAKPRSLFELALENAVEGCVREAFGALVATHQAEHASDPSLRAMFAAIAGDETEHAGLSLDLAEWITPKLSEAQRAAILRAREEAFAELEAALEHEPSHEEIAVGGMPPRATARRLLVALRRLDPDAAHVPAAPPAPPASAASA